MGRTNCEMGIAHHRYRVGMAPVRPVAAQSAREAQDFRSDRVLTVYNPLRAFIHVN